MSGVLVGDRLRTVELPGTGSPAYIESLTVRKPAGGNVDAGLCYEAGAMT